MTHIDLYEPGSGPLWDESVKATDQMCSLGNERYCCDGKCNDNQGRGTCPANQDAGEPLNKEERRFVRLTAVVAFTFWVCLIVAAHSLGQWLGWWH